MLSTFEQKFSDLHLNIKGVRLPKIIVKDEDFKSLGLEVGANNEELLRALARKGLEKIKPQVSEEEFKKYTRQTKHEFAIITELGFTDYILLVWDVLNFCKEKDIPVGKGRGSCGGSLILFLIGATGIDPIQNDLLFERFISKARAKSQIIDGVQYHDGSMAPDVDLDICTERRVEVIEYLKQKYPNRFCRLPTISTLATRQALKDSCKIIGEMKDDDAEVITKSIPVIFGQPMPIADALKESLPLQELYASNKSLVEGAMKLEGLMRQKGSHASAFLVSYYDFDDYLPIELDKEGEVVSSFDMNFAQEECIKLDLLGLHGVTLISNIEKSIGEDYKFNPDDPFIYSASQGAELPYGLFQIGAPANYRVFRDTKPKNWSGLADVIALARPGAMAYVSDYIKNEFKDYWGNAAMQSILSKTHNIPIYQEQTMLIASKVFGFSLEDAEILRKVIGKKQIEKVAEWEVKIRNAAKERNLPIELADFYINLLTESASYSFNKSHSVSYSYLSALTLFFKYKYPQHFYCECLKMAENKSDSQSHVAAIQQELHHFDIELLPPDLILSKPSFSIEGRNIRYGFSCIKGVSEKSLDSLQTFLDAKKTNKFEVFAAAQQAKLNVGILCSLIQSGMLSSVSKDREKTVLEAQVWKLLTEKEQTFCLKAGAEYNFDLSKMVQNIGSWIGENGKAVARATRLDTIRSKAEKYKEIYKQNKSYPEFASWYYETHLLGYSWSTSLKKIFKPAAQYIETIEEVANKKDNSAFEGVYQIAEVKTGISAKGNKWMKVKIQDETGAFYGMLIGDNYVNYLQQEIAPKDKDVVHVKGRKGADIFWIDKMKIQTNKVFIKLSDIK